MYVYVSMAWHTTALDGSLMMPGDWVLGAWCWVRCM